MSNPAANLLAGDCKNSGDGTDQSWISEALQNPELASSAKFLLETMSYTKSCGGNHDATSTNDVGGACGSNGNEVVNSAASAFNFGGGAFSNGFQQQQQNTNGFSVNANSMNNNILVTLNQSQANPQSMMPSQQNMPSYGNNNLNRHQPQTVYNTNVNGISGIPFSPQLSGGYNTKPLSPPTMVSAGSYGGGSVATNGSHQYQQQFNNGGQNQANIGGQLHFNNGSQQQVNQLHYTPTSLVGCQGNVSIGSHGGVIHLQKLPQSSSCIKSRNSCTAPMIRQGVTVKGASDKCSSTPAPSMMYQEQGQHSVHQVVSHLQVNQHNHEHHHHSNESPGGGGQSQKSSQCQQSSSSSNHHPSSSPQQQQCIPKDLEHPILKKQDALQTQLYQQQLQLQRHQEQIRQMQMMQAFNQQQQANQLSSNNQGNIQRKNFNFNDGMTNMMNIQINISTNSDNANASSDDNGDDFNFKPSDFRAEDDSPSDDIDLSFLLDVGFDSDEGNGVERNVGSSQFSQPQHHQHQQVVTSQQELLQPRKQPQHQSNQPQHVTSQLKQEGLPGSSLAMQEHLRQMCQQQMKQFQKSQMKQTKQKVGKQQGIQPLHFQHQNTGNFNPSNIHRDVASNQGHETLSPRTSCRPTGKGTKLSQASHHSAGNHHPIGSVSSAQVTSSPIFGAISRQTMNETKRQQAVAVADANASDREHTSNKHMMIQSNMSSSNVSSNHYNYVKVVGGGMKRAAGTDPNQNPPLSQDNKRIKASSVPSSVSSPTKLNNSSSLYDYFVSMLSSRGYTPSKLPAKQLGYMTEPTPLQLASFGFAVCSSIKPGGADRLTALLSSGE